MDPSKKGHGRCWRQALDYRCVALGTRATTAFRHASAHMHLNSPLREYHSKKAERELTWFYETRHQWRSPCGSRYIWLLPQQRSRQRS
jgi:hypothetical protein